MRSTGACHMDQIVGQVEWTQPLAFGFGLGFDEAYLTPKQESFIWS